MRKFIWTNNFLWFWELFFLCIPFCSLFLIFFNLFGLNYLNSLFLSPVTFSKLLVNIDLFFNAAAVLTSIIGVKTLTIVYQKWANVNLFLILIVFPFFFRLFLLFDLLFFVIFLIWLFLLFFISSTYLFSQFLFFPLGLLYLPIFSFLLLNICGPVNPTDLLLFIGILINFLFKILFHFNNLLPESIYLFL